MITLDLNVRFQPKHRHELEDAIDDILRQKGLGCVEGGGTSMDANGEIEACDIIIEAEINHMEEIADILNIIGIAKGSFLCCENKRMAVGTLEGLALYLSTNLDNEVYQNCDVNYVIEQTEKAMEGIGSMYSYREIDIFTALYYYGISYESMRASISTFIADYPLCKDCKVLQIA